MRGGGGGANTQNNTSVKERVGLSAGGEGLYAEKYGILNEYNLLFSYHSA